MTPLGCSQTSRLAATQSRLADAAFATKRSRCGVAACDLGTGDACDLATALPRHGAVHVAALGLALETGATAAAALRLPLPLPHCAATALPALWLQALRTARAAPQASRADGATMGGAAGKNGGTGGACWRSGKRGVW
jgi:hypothetical protein